jgi:hypothetical protein
MVRMEKGWYKVEWKWERKLVEERYEMVLHGFAGKSSTEGRGQMVARKRSVIQCDLSSYLFKVLQK